MAVAFGDPAWLPQLADRLGQRISDVTKIPRDRVFEYAGDFEGLLKTIQAEKCVAVWFDWLKPDVAAVAGGGVPGTVMDGLARADVFARLATGREQTDARILRDFSAGLAETVRLTAKAIHVFSAEQNGSSPFTQPSRLAPGGIDWTFHRKLPTGWAAARVLVSFRFRADLS
jgi:hypothetical protein